MAVACLLCMVVALLLVQDVQSRKLLWTEQEKKEITHGGLGNHGAAAGRSTTLVSVVSLNLRSYCTYCYAKYLSETETSPLQQSEYTHARYIFA